MIWTAGEIISKICAEIHYKRSRVKAINVIAVLVFILYHIDNDRLFIDNNFI